MNSVVFALRVLVSLAVVGGLLWVVHRRSARWARKTRHAGTRIDVIGKRPLGQKASVAVVDIDGTRFVLGVTEHGVTVLHSTDAPREEQEAATAPARSRKELADRRRGAPNPPFLAASTWKTALTKTLGGTR